MDSEKADTYSPNEEEIVKLKQELTEWAENEKLPNAQIDDELITKFLQGCKYRVKTAKDKIKSYHKLRYDTPEWFSSRDPLAEDIQGLLDIGIYLPLPEKDEKECVTIFVRPTLQDPSVFPLAAVYKTTFMLLDLVMHLEDAITKNGIHAVVDLEGLSFGHILELTPSIIKKSVQAWQSSYPVRFKSFTFYNCPHFARFILNLMKNFMGSKLKKRLKILSEPVKTHNDPENINKKPMEYGGTNGSLPDVIKYWKEKAEEHRPWLLNQCK